MTRQKRKSFGTALKELCEKIETHLARREAPIRCSGCIQRHHGGVVKLTADTITDEQIAELRDEPHRFARSMLGADCVYVAAMHALRGDRDSRARCAELLNARSKERDS